MQHGFVTAVAMNGSSAIHDFEVAMGGATSEEVGDILGSGKFGMVRETAEQMNSAINAALGKGIGLGEALGQAIVELGGFSLSEHAASSPKLGRRRIPSPSMSPWERTRFTRIHPPPGSDRKPASTISVSSALLCEDSMEVAFISTSDLPCSFRRFF